MAHQWSEVAESVQEELTKVAKEIVREGKGILAVDEFNEGAGELLASVGQENTAENRRKFREMLFTTPGLEKYVSGVILYDETVWQKTSTGIPFPEYLASRGIIPGVKADCDVVPLLGTDGEVTTQGLDDLLQRSKKYRKAGIRFAKWRCVLQIADNKPSPLSVNESAHVNARYAACSQQAGLVPVVEPDILNAGTHDIGVSQRTTEKVFSAFYKAMSDQHVCLEGTLLKPAFCTPGQTGGSTPGQTSGSTPGQTGGSTPGQRGGRAATAEEVADVTLKAFRRCVPSAVSGICFLSGGLGDTKATSYLAAINARKADRAPWPLTFSYGRALTGTAWKAWGKECNTNAAQTEFIKRCEANSRASKGLSPN